MSRLIITTWLWGDKYSDEYVSRLASGFMDHLDEAHRFVIVTDRNPKIEGTEVMPIPNLKLTRVRGCFARLQTFDPVWQNVLGAKDGDRIVIADLDSVVIKDLGPLFSRPDPFMILQGANAANPCPYNGSLWMVRAGYRPDVWSDFSLDAAVQVPYYEFPDDQAWLAHKLPGENGWKAGKSSGVYAFKKPGWPEGDNLPSDARLVVFPGSRDPKQFRHLGWVKENWR